MEILIDEQEFVQELLENGLIVWGISGKKYRKKCFLTDMNGKI